MVTSSNIDVSTFFGQSDRKNTKPAATSTWTCSDVNVNNCD